MREPFRFGHLINNKEVDAAAWIEVRDPGRPSDLIGVVGDATSDQVAQACQAAQRALPAWRDMSPQTRGQRLLAAADALDRLAPELERVLVREQGMVCAVTRVELRLAAEELRSTVEMGVPFLQDELHEGPHSVTVTRKRPYGVVAGIVPWNAPIILTLNVLAPALLAGNTLVLKPSELAPLGVNMLLRQLAILFPPGVVNVINGGAQASRTLVDDARVRKVSFTGGGATARHVMAACAASLKDVQLELGGNDPAIVLDDADLNSVVPELVQAVFRRAGQYCFAVKRIYVAHRLYKDFLQAFCAHTDRIRVGHPSHPESGMGPVISASKVAHIRSLVQQAAERGARVFELGSFLEGEPSEGNYLLPVVLADVDAHCDIVTQEQFGPAIPILSFKDDAQAIALANDTEFGLCASVWSASWERAAQVAAQIDSGRVYINAHRGTSLGHRHMPFGGLKQSGIGWSNGVHGVAAFVQYHSVDGARADQ